MYNQADWSLRIFPARVTYNAATTMLHIETFPSFLGNTLSSIAARMICTSADSVVQNRSTQAPQAQSADDDFRVFVNWRMSSSAAPKIEKWQHSHREPDERLGYAGEEDMIPARLVIEGGSPKDYRFLVDLVKMWLLGSQSTDICLLSLVDEEPRFVMPPVDSCNPSWDWVAAVKEFEIELNRLGKIVKIERDGETVESEKLLLQGIEYKGYRWVGELTCWTIETYRKHNASNQIYCQSQIVYYIFSP